MRLFCLPGPASKGGDASITQTYCHSRLWLSLPINLFTNLLLNCSLSLINITWLYIVLLILGEVLVFLIEWGMYQLIQKDNKNWWYSLSTNLASFLLGSLFVYLLFLFV